MEKERHAAFLQQGDRAAHAHRLTVAVGEEADGVARRSSPVWGAVALGGCWPAGHVDDGSPGFSLNRLRRHLRDSGATTTSRRQRNAIRGYGCWPGDVHALSRILPG
jgi:hypothetical protein